MGNRTIVITGSTRGLGLATARACYESNANIVISSENDTELQSALNSFNDGNRVGGYCCDVTKLSDVKGLCNYAINKFGSIDTWINNAGITSPSGLTDEVPLKNGELLIKINILGTYYGSITAIRRFKKQGHGRLINVLGRGSKHPVPTANLYASSKTWIRNFTKAIAREIKTLPIDICTFNPGLIITKLTEKPSILSTYPKALKGLKIVLPLIGVTAERAGIDVAKLALSKKKLPVENTNTGFFRLIKKVVLRGVFKYNIPFDPEKIKPIYTEPEYE